MTLINELSLSLNSFLIVGYLLTDATVFTHFANKITEIK